MIIGVMNGLQNDLREKILIGSPDIRVLTFGEDMVMTDWQTMLKKVRGSRASSRQRRSCTRRRVVHATRHKYFEAAVVEGIPPDGPGVPQVTKIRKHVTAGDFSFSNAGRKASRRGARDRSSPSD